MHFIYCESNITEKKTYTSFILSSANYIISYYLIPTIKDRTIFFLFAKAYSPKNKEYFYILERSYSCDEDIGDKSFFNPVSSLFSKIKLKAIIPFIIFNGNNETNQISTVVKYLVKEKMSKIKFTTEIEEELTELYKMNRLCYRLHLTEEELSGKIINRDFKFLKEYNLLILKRMK